MTKSYGDDLGYNGLLFRISGTRGNGREELLPPPAGAEDFTPYNTLAAASQSLNEEAPVRGISLDAKRAWRRAPESLKDFPDAKALSMRSTARVWPNRDWKDCLKRSQFDPSSEKGVCWAVLPAGMSVGNGGAGGRVRISTLA